MATWGARVVLVDDNGVRATMTASWLKQMGWHDVAVLVARSSRRRVGHRAARAPRARPGRARSVPGSLQRTCATGWLPAGWSSIDLEPSRRYAQGHIPGAWFAIRSRFRGALAKLPADEAIVLTSADGALAQLAAAELRGRATGAGDGPGRWHRRPGRPGRLATRDRHDPHGQRPEDVLLSPRDRGQGREEAMREYPAWEINLVNQMATTTTSVSMVGV